MKVIAFGASNSQTSINKQLATYAAKLLGNVETEILDLNDYELPLFGVDREKKLGQPALAADFLAKIGSADGVIISFAEHNGSYSAAYKNLFDWCSRINPKVFQGKPMVLLATSPGARGAMTVLEQAKNSIPRFNGDVRATLSVPSFYENFDGENLLISNEDIREQLVAAVKTLL